MLPLNQKELYNIVIRYIFHKNICIFSRLSMKWIKFFLLGPCRQRHLIFIIKSVNFRNRELSYFRMRVFFTRRLNIILNYVFFKINEEGFHPLLRFQSIKYVEKDNILRSILGSYRCGGRPTFLFFVEGGQIQRTKG